MCIHRILGAEWWWMFPFFPFARHIGEYAYIDAFIRMNVYTMAFTYERRIYYLTDINTNKINPKVQVFLFIRRLDSGASQYDGKH